MPTFPGLTDLKRHRNFARNYKPHVSLNSVLYPPWGVSAVSVDYENRTIFRLSLYGRPTPILPVPNLLSSAAEESQMGLRATLENFPSSFLLACRKEDGSSDVVFVPPLYLKAMGS